MIGFTDLFYGEYVPPCERNPYYQDPRDVNPNDTFNDTVSGSEFIDLSQCPLCCGYFQPWYGISKGGLGMQRYICKDCSEKEEHK